MSDSAHSLLIVLAVTFLVVATAVVVHLVVLRRLSVILARIEHRRVVAPLVMIFSLIAAHVSEIWLFAGGYAFLTSGLGVGALTGIEGRISDFTYFSGMVYTTVGFGDVLPEGPIRLMAGTEALIGLLMIAWSASFTYLEMQRFWGRERGAPAVDRGEPVGNRVADR